MRQADVYRMIRRRATAASIDIRVGCHTFRATGITEFLKAGGTLDMAQRMAGHKSARTTRLYDRRAEGDPAKEIERLAFRSPPLHPIRRDDEWTTGF
jgi:integrase